MKSDDWFRSRANDICGSLDGVEVDQNAEVSRGEDNGAYVAAWIWVQIEEGDEDEEEDEDA